MVTEFDSAENATVAHGGPDYQDALAAMASGAERDAHIVEGAYKGPIRRRPVMGDERPRLRRAKSSSADWRPRPPQRFLQRILQFDRSHGRLRLRRCLLAAKGLRPPSAELTPRLDSSASRARLRPAVHFPTQNTKSTKVLSLSPKLD